MKNLLSENMRRFNTKNLNEQLAKPPSNSKNSDLATVRVMQFVRAHGATDNELKTALKIDQQELDRLDNLSVDIKQADQHGKNAIGILTKFPVLAARVEHSGIKAKSDLIMMYSEMGRTEEVAIILYFIRSERDAEIVSTYIRNRTKMDLYNFLRSKFSPIEMTTRYIGDVSIINSLRRLKVYTVTKNLSEQNATEPRRLKLLLMYNDGPQKGKTARQIDVLYGYKNAIKPSSLGAVFKFEIAETDGPSGGFLGRYVCRSGKIEVLPGRPHAAGSTSPQLTGIYMISAQAKELMEALTGCSDYAFNDTDVSTTNYV